MRDPERRSALETSPDPWISALRHSHDRLRALVEPLDPGQLRQRSYASEWSIAQVLSHIGSQSEIFGLWLDAGLSGQDPPGRDVFGPIWDKWNAKEPQDQAADALQADQETTGEAIRLTASHDDEGLPELRLPAEAFVRLLYGRLDPDHTPPVESAGVDLDELRQLFPGF
jgi:hypothetical protein